MRVLAQIITRILSWRTIALCSSDAGWNLIVQQVRTGNRRKRHDTIPVADWFAYYFQVHRLLAGQLSFTKTHVCPFTEYPPFEQRAINPALRALVEFFLGDIEHLVQNGVMFTLDKI